MTTPSSDIVRYVKVGILKSDPAKTRLPRLVVTGGAEGQVHFIIIFLYITLAVYAAAIISLQPATHVFSSPGMA